MDYVHRAGFLSFSILAVSSTLIAPGAFAAPNAAVGTLGSTPLYFTENRGQWDERVLFKADGGNGVTWWFERDGLTLAVTAPDTQVIIPAQAGIQAVLDKRDAYPTRGQPDRHPRKGHALKLRFVPSLRQSSDLVFASNTVAKQSQPAAEVIPSGKLSWNNNYFLGNDESKWAPDCGNFTRITYRNVWEGIDVVYYGQGDRLKYDYVISPCADPADVRLRWLGLEEPLSVIPAQAGIQSTLPQGVPTLPQGVRTLRTGTDERQEKDSSSKPQDEDILRQTPGLLLATSVGTLREGIPLAYQRGEDGSRIPVEVGFAVLSANEVGLEVTGDWDRSKELVVDPLVWSTYLGGYDMDFARAATLDEDGVVVVTGNTWSVRFPCTEGAFDDSLNYGDAFITGISREGTELSFSTFIGGTGHESAYAIDGNNEGIVVTGKTTSGDFPTTDGAFDNSINGERPDDAFIVRINHNGSRLLYGTYLGGSSYESARAITLLDNGDLVVGGQTSSSDFPVTEAAFSGFFSGGNYDVFITRLNRDGSELVFSTYLGGSNSDMLNAITSDSSGEVIVAGASRSHNFPTTEGAFDRSNEICDAFLTRISGSGNDLVFSTFLGGAGESRVLSVISNNQRGITIAGYTYASDFPTTEGVMDVTFNGGADAFITGIIPDGSDLRFGTFIGGLLTDNACGFVPDGIGGYVVLGVTNSNDFPTTSGALDRTANGDLDAYIARMNENGNELTYSSYFGGTGKEYPAAIAIDEEGGVAITGWTESTDFPITNGAFDPSFNSGYWDAFITKFNADSLAIIEPSILPVLPSNFILSNPFPNPFNSSTTIRFGLPVTGEVSLRVTDTNGRLMATLVGNRLEAGYHEVIWNAEGFAAGIYLVELQADNGKVIKKITLIR